MEPYSKTTLEKIRKFNELFTFFYNILVFSITRVIKEFLQTGRYSDLYENIEKEYKISQKGLNEFYSLQKNKNFQNYNQKIKTNQK